MISTTLAIAADYADAIAVARRAKNWCFLILLLVLVAQLAVFLTARLDRPIMAAAPPSPPVPATAVPPASATAAAGKSPAASATPTERRISAAMEYAIDVTDFLGLITAVVLAVVMLLLVGIMLVGRLVGVAHVTGAFVGCAVLVVMLFPWQAFLNQSRDPHAPDVRIPGVLYTWPELLAQYDFANSPINEAMLHWARYVGFPAAALIVLAGTQIRANRGLAMSLGETDVTPGPRKV